MGVVDFVKEQDLFRVPVQLRYKGKRGFTTFIGGCCSIMFVLTVIALFTVYSHNFLLNPKFDSN